MGILNSIRRSDRDLTPVTLNTGTIFDLATGSFVPGKDNSMILNGGLILSNGITGRAQMFKSSIDLSYFMNTLINYHEAEGLVYDSEISIPGKSRLIDLSSSNDPSLYNRFELFSKADYGMEELFGEVRKIANEKDLHKKDYTRETPFLDINGKPILTWVPTLVGIDSWSGLSTSKETEAYEKLELGDSKTNTLAMYEGKLKTDFSRMIPTIAAKHGIYFILTAHIDSEIKMDAYAPTNKDVPMMRGSDKLKRVGSQFKFLTPNMIETRKTELLQDSNKKCQYPYHLTSSDVELQKVTAVVCRCKNNVSGSQFSHVSSQFSGVQKWLDYFLIIKDCKSELLTGTTKQKLAITDHEFTRQSLRDLIATDPKFRRALEILGQFIYIRNNFNIPEISNMGYMEFAKRFNASKDLKEEMLNSTGIWQFTSAKSDKKYMSIVDIYTMLNKK